MELIEVDEWFEMKDIVGEALDKLPQDIYEWARENLYFIYPPSAIFSESIKKLGSKEGIVLITDRIMDYSEDEQAYVIAHAIAHRKLNHKMEFDREIINREIEADELAFSWLPFKVLRELIRKGWKRCDRTGLWYHPRREMCIRSAYSSHLFH